MYLPEHDLVVTYHAACHWRGRCGNRVPHATALREIAAAVALARPATRRESLELDHWQCRRDEWSYATYVPGGDTDTVRLVHEAANVALVVATDGDCPAVLTCIPYDQLRADGVMLRRRRKRRAKRVAKRNGG